jgi:tetratricopeptide (TPR) repeat protein
MTPRLAIIAAVVVMTATGCGVMKRTGSDDLTGAADVMALNPEFLRHHLAEAESLSVLHPDEPFYGYRVGLLHSQLDERAHAELALLTTLEGDPFYAPALSLLSKLYFEDGRHEEAILRLEPACERQGQGDDGVPQELRAGLALHYDAVGEIEFAEELVRRTLLEGADWSRCGSALTFVRLRGESFQTAREIAELSLNGAQRNAVNLNNYGITEVQAGDPETAQKLFLEAIELDPTLPGPYYNLAILEKYYFLNDAAAADWFARYWERSQEDPDALAEVFFTSPDTAGDASRGDAGSLAVREEAP